MKKEELMRQLERINKDFKVEPILLTPPLVESGGWFNERDDGNWFVVDYLDIMFKDDLQKIESKGKTMTKRELEEKIIKLRKDYWDGNCTTPDSEYDTLVEELRTIDPKHPLLTTPEHGDSKSKGKVAHVVPMLSLQKVYNKEDLYNWMKSVSRNDDEEFLVQPKYDGISCHYQKGMFSTRGDGNVGENVSDVCSAIAKFDMKDNEYGKIDFYGEIVIKKSDFNTIYKNVRRDNGETFKNSRNAVAGILNADDYNFYKKQGAVLTLVDYDKYSLRMKLADFDLKWNLFRTYIMDLDYPMDGIVVKIADPIWREQQGFTAHHPKGAMAFKFANVSAQTYLKDIEWGMGKEYITATAIFQPVNLNGVTVSRAVVPMNSKTLPCIMKGNYNLDALLTVERAGDVIPHITSVSPAPTSVFFTIDKCPFCGGEIEVVDSGVRCLNPNCKRKKIHRVYESLVQLGIKNVGEATVTTIYEAFANINQINLNWWILCIPYLKDKISCLPTFGDASAQIIVDETNKILHTTVEKFIAALGIPNVGVKIGREIKKKFHSIYNFISDATFENLSELDGVGDIMAKRIMNWMQVNNGENKGCMISLANLFTFEEDEKENEQTETKGTVCFTGAMRMKRSEMQSIAQSAGYTPVDAVTKDLSILVVADSEDLTSSKCKKAQKYGTKIIREDEFLNFCKK